MSGSGFLATSIIVLLLIALKLSQKREENCVSLWCVLSIVFLGAIIFIAFQIWGSIVVFIRYKDFSTGHDQACHTVTFLYAFSLLIIFWLLIPFACVFCLCCTVDYMGRY